MIKILLRFVLPVGVVVGAGVWLYFAIMNRQININGWFTGGMTMGVDVSSYQENVDFNELYSQNVKFAYIKATEGTNHVDASFKEKWAAANEAGMAVGAYHYFSYGESGAAQAENFVSVVGELGTSRLIPAVDLELTTAETADPPDTQAVVKELKDFLAVIEGEYGVKPLLYSRQDYYKRYLETSFLDYPRWVTNVFFPVYFEAGDGWMMWQYNDCGRLKGYSGEECIDLNVVKNLDEIRVK